MKKLLVTLLCIVMVVSLMPAMAFASSEPEAKIGDVEYVTLEEAFKNVQDDQVITLLSDVVIDETIVVDKLWTYLDLNGYSISTTLGDKPAFNVVYPAFDFAIYDECYYDENFESVMPEFGTESSRFAAKVFVDEYANVAIANQLYDGTQIVYDKDAYSLVVGAHNGTGITYLTFDVCLEEEVTYFYATQKCGDLYFSEVLSPDADDPIKDVFGLEGKEYERIGTHMEFFPLNPGGKTINSSWWCTFVLRHGANLTEALDWEYSVTEKYSLDDLVWYFNSNYYKGYEVEKWVEVLDYEIDEKGNLKSVKLGNEVPAVIDEFMMVAPIWKEVEAPKIEASGSSEKVVVVADAEEQEKAIKATNKLIADIADGKDSTVKVDSNIEQMVKTSLESGVEDFEVYAEAKVESLEKDQVSSADLSLISDQVGDGTIAQYLNLSVELSVIALGSDILPTAGNIYQLDEEMTFNIEIPKELKDVPTGMQREYYVIRVHDGKAEVLDVRVNDNGTLSFDTDRFSTYALAYKDVPVVAEAEVPNTGNDTGMMLWLAVLGITAACAVGFKRKEN